MSRKEARGSGGDKYLRGKGDGDQKRMAHGDRKEEETKLQNSAKITIYER